MVLRSENSAAEAERSMPGWDNAGRGTQPALTVTYHAPATTGTFHINVQWSSIVTPIIIKAATSVITVTP